MEILASIGNALHMAFAMFWEILWALILGFFLSAIVQAVVSKSEMKRLLPDDSSKTLSIAALLGAASSSCSYAAVALARSIFRKGADFTAAMVFQLASTNLVIELGIIMVVLMGWQFAAAEFLGAPVMIAILAFLFRAFLTPEMVEEAKRQADKGIPGSMEGHAEMDMAVTDGPLMKRILSQEGQTSISHYFVMDWVSIWISPADCCWLARLPSGSPRISGRYSFLRLTQPWRKSGGQSWGRWLRSPHSFARLAMCRWPLCSGAAESASEA
jgi:uncharacterized membrane protein YraQ (UPF0718 family)